MFAREGERRPLMGKNHQSPAIGRVARCARIGLRSLERAPVDIAVALRTSNVPRVDENHTVAATGWPVA